MISNLLCADTSRGDLTGGACRDRTDDPLLAKQVLSQLSYGPKESLDIMVGLGGLEPPASPLSGVRSNHLSYRPMTTYSLTLAAVGRHVACFAGSCRCLVWTSCGKAATSFLERR